MHVKWGRLGSTAMSKSVAVIGCGNMGAAIVKGLLSSGWTTTNLVTVTTPSSDRCHAMAELLGVTAGTTNAEAIKGKDVVLLCVKPQIMPDVLRELQPVFNSNQLIISIAAGISLNTIESYSGEAAVIRSMPNLPVTVNMGATAISPGTHAKTEHLAIAEDIFAAVGIVERVPEYLLDAVTGLSGTGPMYVFYMIEALADAGVKVGLSRATSTRLAMQTVRGSGKLAELTDVHPAALKDMVSSPGGTSITALHVLRQQGYAAILMDAVEAATNRSKELGS
jgi:pyrroline-5-carboxylate reductase